MAALFADSRINGGAKISIKSSFMAVDFLCAFSRSDVPRKTSSIRSKPADSMEKREERCDRSKPA